MHKHFCLNFNFPKHFYKISHLNKLSKNKCVIKFNCLFNLDAPKRFQTRQLDLF